MNTSNIDSSLSARIKARLQELKSQGVILGRPRKVDLNRMLELRSRGMSLRQIGRELGCERTTISKALKACKIKAENGQ
jgi:DNA invertase Pin-like site-specific DNA recombinase